MNTAWDNTARSSWDFFSGRGEGATRADRWAVRQRRASQALGGTLARDDDFWAYAVSIEASKDPEQLAEEIAALYVPRRSPQRAAIIRLLKIASQDVEQRYDRKGRAGLGVLRVTTAAGPVAYFPDDESVRSNAFSVPGMEVLDLGAQLVARRGGQRCLACDQRLRDARRPTYRGNKAWTEQANYCDECLDGSVGQQLQRKGNDNLPNILLWHFEAMRKVLHDATPQILSAAGELGADVA